MIASDDVRTALPEQVVFIKCIKGSCATSKLFYVYLKAGTVASRSLLEEVEGKVHRQGGLPRTCLEVFFLFFCPIQDVYFKKTMVIATMIHSLSGKSGKFAEDLVRSCQAILCVRDGDQVISINIIIIAL